MLYLILKWVHILLAIAAVGANLTYGIWLARGGRDQQHLDFVLRGVRILDDRVANPAYGLLLVTGLAMVFVGGLEITTPWILTGLGLYVAAVLLGMLGYGPTLRRQIRLVSDGSAGTAEFAALTRRAGVLGVVLTVLVATISFLMVVKPSLWAG